jgi:8-oxo-dGTP pyrophosphatase MutT (NUDIX family)
MGRDFPLGCAILQAAMNASKSRKRVSPTKRAVIQQAAAIAVRRSARRLQVCLIRRKGSKSWGIPKGVVDRGDTRQETALNEAWEEAGLRGRLIGDAIGTYKYKKWDKTLRVAVYVMEVLDQAATWEEAWFRERRWTSFEKAASRLAGHPVQPLLDRVRSVLLHGAPKQAAGLRSSGH